MFSENVKSQKCILNPLLNKSRADLPRSAYDGGDDILHRRQKTINQSIDRSIDQLIITKLLTCYTARLPALYS